MKFDRIIWGVLLLFIGGVLLLDNFNIIEFYWRNIWDFWPLVLIILGINILFNRNNSQMGNIISLGVLVVALGFLFVKGQEKPNGSWWNRHVKHNIKFDDEDDYGDTANVADKNVYNEQYLASYGDRKTVLNISGGGATFDLKGEADSLFTAKVSERRNNFLFTKTFTDSVHVLNFKMRNRGKEKWNFGNGDNDIDIYLNTNPIWVINLKMGAGQTKFDVSNYKVRTLNFDGGAAELDVKVGSLLPITDVNVKTGVADVKVKIPEGSGCRVTTKTGLSSKDFVGFTKIDENLYETPNFKTATNKIFIKFDGGLSSFEVDRY